MQTPTTPTSRARGHEWLPQRAENETSVGSRERAPKVWQVKPTGPSGEAAVTTATPVTKCPRISLNRATSMELTRLRLPKEPRAPSDEPRLSSRSGARDVLGVRPDHRPPVLR